MKQQRISQADKKLLRHMDHSMDEMRGEFSSSKSMAGYTMRLEQSLERMSTSMIDNLFAIVMPAGSGKTWFAERYGFVDVDKCVSAVEHEELFWLRKKIITAETRWVEHNDMWNRKVRSTLEQLDYSRPVVLMCHSEEMAFELGATPMVAILLNEDVWRDNISGRTELAKRFSELSRHTVMKHTRKVPLMRARSNEVAERIIIKACTAYGLPVAAPNKYDATVNNHYGRTVPSWVLKGDVNAMDVNVLLRLKESGEVPKECLDYFFRSQNIPASFGYGFTMFHWSELVANMRALANNRQKLDMSKDWMELYPYASDREKNRMNVGLKRLAEKTNMLEDDNVIDILEHHVGENHQFVTMLVTYWCGIGRHLSVAKFVLQLLKVSHAAWKSVSSEFHTLVRLSDYVMNTELADEKERQSLMYMNTLLGKRIFTVDEDAEIKDRTGKQPTHLSYDKVTRRWSQEQYWKDFGLALRVVHHRFEEKPRKATVQSFEEFYKRREEWVTKGSLVYNTIPRDKLKYTVQIVDEVSGVIKEIQERHNKRSLYECYDAINLMADKFELFNVTKAVGKLNENGYKDRVLLPGGLLHYNVFAYVLFCAEQQEQVGSVRLNAPPDDDLRYMDVKMHAGLYKLLYDWANFNVQHSSREMAEVIKHLGEVVPGGRDYKAFCDLIAESMYNLVMEKRDGSRVKLDFSLYSGWRGTTWINTTLNAVYTTIGGWNFERLYGYKSCEFADHGGDDLDEEFGQPEDAYRMLAVMDRMGFDATKSKQMIGTTSEFFRVTINRTGAYASPTRGLATFVSGNWEGTGNVPIQERIVSIVDMAWKLIRRGVEPTFMATLAEVTITKWAKIKGEVDWMSLPNEVLHGSLESNGMGIPDKDGNVWDLDVMVPPMQGSNELVLPGTLAATDYIAVLDSELKNNNINIEKWEAIAAKMAEGGFNVNQNLDLSYLLGFKANVVAKRAVVTPKWNEGAFTLLMEFEGTPKRVASQMARLERYQAILPYLSVSGKQVSEEDLMAALGIVGNADVLRFAGDVYYRRLVGEPIAKLITDFCRMAIYVGGMELDRANELFRTLTYMASKIFSHRI